MLNFDRLKKTLTAALFVSAGNFAAIAGEAQKAIAIQEDTQGILYRLDQKTGEVVAVPLSSKLLEEHNIDGKSINKKQIELLAGIDSKGALPKGVALKAAKRTSSSDEFNDADAAAKPALYFSISAGFGRPYWGDYRPYYNNYRPYYNNYTYVNRPYYYNGYYAPRVIYTNNSWYSPVYTPCYYGNYTYSYYNCGGCW